MSIPATVVAHDAINDVAIIETSDGLYVRYVLEVKKCSNMIDAMDKFYASIEHALRANGFYDEVEASID